MKLFYISSQLVDVRRPAGVIQMLYTVREFQKSLAERFVFVLRRVEDKEVMASEGIPYQESGCPFRARVLFYLVWLPWFWVKQGRIQEQKILYCLDWHVAVAAILYKKIFKYKIAIEYHDPPFGSWKDSLIVRYCNFLLPTTRAMKQYLIGINQRAEQKSWVIPNGIDLDRFANIPPKEECRRKLDLPLDKKIVLYSGNFVARKGIYVLAEAASLLDKEILVVLIGGHDPDSISEFKEKVGERKNILVGGYKPHDEIPYWIGACDVAVAPNSANAETEQGEAAIKWTSPMKIYEYMAAGRPIVASDIPAMHEIIDEESAILVEPDSPKALAEGINAAIQDKEKTDRLVAKAFENVKEHTWEKRNEKIFHIFETE
jgi:glycosyltransferase involved in cell wall biosynthesis